MTNSGTASADNSAGYIFIGFYISEDASRGGDRLLVGGRESITLPMAPGATVSVGIYNGMRIPDDITPGSYYLLGVVDEQGSVTESNENDNVATIPITIQ